MLLLFTIKMWQIFSLVGATWTLEHPEDPGKWPFPSIWITEEVLQLFSVTGACKGIVDQCMHGAPSRKGTCIGGTVCEHQM